MVFPFLAAATIISGASTYYGLTKASSRASDAVADGTRAIREATQTIHNISTQLPVHGIAVVDRLGHHAREVADNIGGSINEVARSITYFADQGRQGAADLATAINHFTNTADIAFQQALIEVAKARDAFQNVGNIVAQAIHALGDRVVQAASILVVGAALLLFLAQTEFFKSPRSYILSLLPSIDFYSTSSLFCLMYGALVAVIVFEMRLRRLEMKTILLKKQAKNLSEIGKVCALAGDNVPNGWLSCNGAVLHLPEHVLLGQLIGTRYDNGGIAQRLPDFRGRVPVGAGHGYDNPSIVAPGALRLTNRPLGAYYGTESTPITINHLPAHTHTGTTNTNNASHTHRLQFLANPGNGGTATISDNINYNHNGSLAYDTGENTPPESNPHRHTFTTDATGGGTNLPIMQPAVIVNWIIKFK